MRMLLAVPLAVLLALEFYHCSRRNGRRFAVRFFAAAIIFGVIRANVIGFITWSHNDPMPYTLVGPALRVGFASLVEPFGWAFALYGSWFLAEGMLRKATGRSAQLFPVVFLSTLLMGGFAYAVEAAATPMDWWHWTMVNVSSPWFHAVPLIGIMDWGSVAIDFLMVFLILECSRWGRSRWSYLAAGVFVAHMLTHLFPAQLPQMLQLFDVWHWTSTWAVAAAAFFVPLELTASRGRGAPVSLWSADGSDRLDWLPMISVAGMLVIVVYAVAARAGDPLLLFSALVLAAAMLMAAPGVPLWPVAGVLVAGALVTRYALPALAPAALVIIYARLEGRGGRARAAAVALLAAGLVLYVPWAYARSGRVAEMRAALGGAGRAAEAGRDGEALGGYAKAYARTAKYAGGDRLLAVMLRLAWMERDREAFDFAARELRTFGPRFEGVEGLWTAGDEAEFARRINAMRALPEAPADDPDAVRPEGEDGARADF